MKTPDWDTFDLDRRRMKALTGGTGIAVFSLIAVLGYPVLGTVAIGLAFVTGLASAYLVASGPKRALELSAIRQAKEAPTMAAQLSVYLTATGSRAKALFSLESDDPQLSGILTDMKKRTLLGLEASFADVPSQAIGNILQSALRVSGSKDEGEEYENSIGAARSGEETKFPVFLTVCFFTPVLLMLLAAVGHHTDIVSVFSLSVLGFVMLHLAFSFTQGDRKKLAL